MKWRLKVYVDLNFIKQEWCDIPFLFPILNLDKIRLSYYHDEQVETWLKYWKQIVQIEKSIENCDYVVFPKNYNLWYLKKLKELCSIAKIYNKKVVVFYMSDVENKLPYIDNLIVFRSSITTKNPSNEYPMPWFPEDLMKYCDKSYQNISITKPSVWYVWYYGYYNLKTKIKYYIHKIAMYIFRFRTINYLIYIFFNYIYRNENFYNSLSVIWTWWVCRKDTIDILKKEKNIKFNFIKREKGLWIYEKKNNRKEYIDNMIKSDFPLVIRWFWNFSFRLSEVMSLWKIPLFIDTDCKLPFNYEVDYKELFIRVPYKDINKIYEYMDIYINKNENKIIEIQKKIREIYEKYYTLTWYYSSIIDKIL